MRRVGVAEAKAQLSALLDAVEAGEEVVITRRGQPVTWVVRDPGPGGTSPDWIQPAREPHGACPGWRFRRPLVWPRRPASR
jgi:antitoxin (DNA-binding transcriptional repressor) of toxin-antitoxin stability system